MQVSFDTRPLREIEADALIVGLFAGEPLDGDAADLNRLLDNALADVAGFAADAELSGKKGETASFYTQGRIAARRVVAVGLGKRAEIDARALREASGAVARELRDRKLKSVVSAL